MKVLLTFVQDPLPKNVVNPAFHWHLGRGAAPRDPLPPKSENARWLRQNLGGEKNG